MAAPGAAGCGVTSAMGKSQTQPKPPDWRQAVFTVMDVLLGLTGAAAVATLVLEYGFRTPPVALSAIRVAQAIIVGLFILDRLARLILSRSRVAYLRENWLDFGLIALAAGLLAVSFYLYGGYRGILSAGTLYIIITQVYILMALMLRAVGFKLKFAEAGIHPTWLLVGSFVFLCLAGSGLLMLPAATPEGQSISYLDALFTATSASCVTGLIVRNTGADFTIFGQAIILALIQLGGLGIMLFGTMLVMLMGKGMSFRTSQALDNVLSTGGIGKIARTVSFVVIVTFSVEIVGAVLLYPMFSTPQGAMGAAPPMPKAVWDSVFHSVSSFCNAGFSLYPSNMMQGVGEVWRWPLRGHWQILGVMAPLIVLGGIGFPVLQDSTRYVLGQLRRIAARIKAPIGRLRGPKARLSLHSRVVLTTSAALILLGAIGLLAVEPGPLDRHVIGKHAIYGPGSAARTDWATMSRVRRMPAALFQSISARTAGFNTINVDELSNAGKMWMCGLMVIGGSPASTAGGVKTATFALLVIGAWSMVRRRGQPEAFRRSISASVFRRAVTVALLYGMLVVAITLGLSIVLPREAFIDVLFEACSACGTVGLSAGVTQRLNHAAKTIVIAAMFIGRIGPLTLVAALTTGIRRVEYAYPTEDVTIG